MISVLETVVPPVTEPVRTAVAAAHMRLDADDPSVRLYLGAARGWAESYLGRALMKQSLLWTISSSPPRGGWPMVGLSAALIVLPQWLSPNEIGVRPLTLPRQPVISIDGIVLAQWGQAETTLDPSTYDTSLSLGQVQIFGGIGLGANGRLGISFTAGYGEMEDAVPFAIRQAILLMASFFYERRGDDEGEPPSAAKMLLNPFRQVTFG